MRLEIIKSKINAALEKLYIKDYFLIENGLREETINHRFAMYLEPFFRGKRVDCEYNISHYEDRNDIKAVLSEHGNIIDGVVRKRDKNPDSDFICFEVKRVNSQRRIQADKEKLVKLTSGGQFRYKYGFYIFFGSTKSQVKIEVFEKGQMIDQYCLS